MGRLDDQGVDAGGQVAKPETARGRVRRLVLDPLAREGMRFPKQGRRGGKLTGEVFRAWAHVRSDDDARGVLDRLADELAPFSDQTLIWLREWARRNGQGSGRTFWPSVPAFLTAAESREPRALELIPQVATWFGSRAGVDARNGDRVVAELRWIVQHRKVPRTDAHKRAVASLAVELRYRIKWLQKHGAQSEEERLALAEHADLARRMDVLIDDGIARRAAEDAA